MLKHLEKKHIFWAWAAWILAALFTTAQFSLQTLSSLLHQFLTRDFNLSATGVGYLSAAFYLTFLPIQIPAGIFYDKFGARPVLTVGACLCGLGTLIFAGSHSLWAAYLGRMLMGMGAGTSFVGLLYITATEFPAKSFGLLVGVGEAIGMFATAILERYGAISIKIIGWRATLEWYGFSLLAITLCIICIAGKLKNQHGQLVKDHSVTKMFAELANIMRSKAAWIAAVIGFGLFSVVSAFSALWSTAFLTDVYQYNNQTAAFAVQFVFYGVAIGCPVITTWLTAYENLQQKIIIYAGLISAILMGILTFSNYLSLPVTCAIMFSLGFLCSSYLISFYILRLASPPHLQGAAGGFGNLSVCAGGLFLQPLIGYLLDLSNNNPTITQGIVHYRAVDYQIAFSSMIIVLLAASVCGLFIKKSTKFESATANQVLTSEQI